jgi:TRAP transporter TAXI family solute receptor
MNRGDIIMRTLVRAVLAVVGAALVAAAPVRAGEPHWPDHLTIGTASPGGTYHVYGDGLARILTRELGLPVAMRATEGPAENIALLEAGEAKLGFVTIGVALQAWNGTGAWAGKTPARSLRAIFPMYDTPFQFMALQDSNIRSVADMAGKRIGIGPRGGTSAAYFPEIFTALKIPANFVFGDWSELAAQVHARSIDALAVAAGVPFPSFIELEAKDKVRYIALSPEQIAALRLAIPELTPSLVPIGTYPSLLRHYQTLGLYNFAVAHADLPNDLVAAIVRVVFERHEEMMEVHAAAAATVPANLERNTFLPLHPGAIRYYRQIGRAGQTD